MKMPPSTQLNSSKNKCKFLVVDIVFCCLLRARACGTLKGTSWKFMYVSAHKRSRNHKQKEPEKEELNSQASHGKWNANRCGFYQ